MSALFEKPIQQVSAPPAPPAIDKKAEAARTAAAEEARKRSQYGRSSTNPTGGLGDASAPNLAAKSLLGA